MFANVLIANRGEIACRIIRTARRMGIKPIALHTPADRGAMFTRLADEAHRDRRGGERLSRRPGDRRSGAADRRRVPASGLRLPVGECRISRRPAPRPGVVFVGPPPEAMRAMGLKNSAKALMQKAGVPVVPGYHGDNQNPKFLREKAYEIGYPVLIKAIAGGGGRGMRRVDAHVEFEAALESASREAQGRLRRRSGADREICRLAPPHRDAGVRRQPRQLRPPVRARLLPAAPPPEGDRGVPVARTAGGDARRHGEGRDRRGSRGRLSGRGHGGVHRRRLARASGRTPSISSR